MQNKNLIRIIGLKNGNVKWVEITEDGRWIAAGGAGKAGNYWNKTFYTLKDICKEDNIKYMD